MKYPKLMIVRNYYLEVILVSIFWVITTAFSSSFSIKSLFPLFEESSRDWSFWWSCRTLFVVITSWLIRLVQSWAVSFGDNRWKLECVNSCLIYFDHLLSAASMSLSLHGISDMPADSSIFLEFIIVLILVILRWSCGRFLGRGGTAGFVGLRTWCCVSISSELDDSSWPTVVKLTLLYEFCIPLRLLIIPAALLGFTYLGFSEPIILFCDAIVGRMRPPRAAVGSLWSESLWKLSKLLECLFNHTE